MRRVLLLLVIAACEKNDPLFCQQNPGASGCPVTDGSMVIDGSVIDGDPGIDARVTFGTGVYEVKLTAVPTAAFTLPATIDTTSNTGPCVTTADWTSPTQPSACFIVATTINVTSPVDVEGSRPLVLIGTDTVKVMSTLDVASHNLLKTGPGANDSGCPTGTAPATNTNGGGGGAGGSFWTVGGAGGKGNSNGTAGGVAGAAITVAPAKLRGGCPGQTGGAGGAGGVAGDGGGSVYAVAGNTIDLRAGSINASGGAANTATGRGGGGGGGSGGMIVLYAPTISTDSNTRLVANGGGGSSGANGSAVGGEPSPVSPNTAAPGGTATGGCGNENGGGAGAAGALTATAGGSVTGSSCGGGGGGGGEGVIQTNVALGSGVVSPPPVVQ